MRIALLIALFANSLCLSAQSAYTDHLYKQWTELYTNHSFDQLESSLLEEMNTEEPQQFTLYVWSQLVQQGHVDAAKAPQSVRDQTEAYLKIQELYYNGDYLSIHQLLKENMGSLMIGGYQYEEYALRLIDNQMAYDYNKARMKKWKEPHFASIWSIANMLILDESSIPPLKKDLEDGFYDRWPAFKTYLNGILQFHPIHERMHAKLVEDYLKTYPDDALAHRYLAKIYKNTYNFEEAIEHYQRSMALDPFYNSNYEDLAYCYAMALDHKKVESVAQLFKGRFNLKSDGEYYRWLSEVYLDAKDRARARDNIKKAIEIGPASAKIYSAYIKLLEDIDRDLAFLSKAELIQLENADHNYWNSLMDYLDNEDEKLALELFHKIKRQGTAINYDLGVNRFLLEKDSTERIRLVKEMISAYPRATYLYNRLGDHLSGLKRYEEAFHAYAKSLAIDPDQRSIWVKIGTAELSWRGGPVIPEVINQGVKDHPEHIAPKLAVASRVDLSETNSLKYWNNHLNKRPGDWKILEQISDIYKDNRRWEALDSIYRENEPEILARGDYYGISNFYFEWGYWLQDKFKRIEPTKDEMSQAKECFIKYGSYNGLSYLTDYWLYQLAMMEGNRELANTHLEASIDRNPNFFYHRDLWTKTSSEKKFQYMKLAVERDPYNSHKLDNLIQLNVNSLWGGSSLEAILRAEEYFELFPDKHSERIENFMNRALGDFGNRVLSYQKVYKNKGSLGSSTLYMGMYQNALDAALGNNNQVVIDPTSRTATITSQSGEIMLIQDDANCGKTTRIQKGEAYIAFEYDDQCRLTKIGNNLEDVVNLKYNQTGKIIHIAVPDYFVDVEYDDKERISLMKSGKDEVIIAYDSLGEMRVESEGYRKMYRITNLMNELLEYTRIPETTYSMMRRGQLLDMSQYDKAFTELHEAYMYGDEKHFYTNSLKLADHLQKNISADAFYGPLLCEIALENIASLKSESEKDKLKFAVPMADHLYQCLLKIRRNGVALDYWDDWTNTFEWLSAERKSIKNKNSKYFSALLALEERVLQHPIVLNSQSNWLPKHVISQDIYWKEINPLNLMDLSLAEETELQCAHIFDGGIYAVGTSKGLLIKHPIWKWMAYDEEKGMMVENPIPEIIKASSDIHSIQPYDGDRVLLATSNGLLVWNPSTNAVERLGIMQGLHSSRIRKIQTFSFNGEPFVIIAHAKGIQTIYQQEIETLDALKDKQINDIHFEAGQPILFASNQGVYSWDLDTLIQLNQQRAVSALYDHGQIMYFDGREVYKVLGKSEIGESVSIDLQLINGNITTTDKGIIHGLKKISIEGSEDAFTALTDNGLSIFHHKHFEHLAVETRDGSAADIHTYAEHNNYRLCLSNKRLYVFDQSKVEYLEEYVIKEMISLDNGHTLLADGGYLKVVSSSGPTNVNYASIQFIDEEEDDLEYYGTSVSGNCSQLYKTSSNSLLFNSGDKICKGVLDSTGLITAKELFRIDLSGHEDYNISSKLMNMLETPDGDIWVSTGLRLYHYFETDTGFYLDQYCYFDDAERFDARTDALGHITRLADGRIWIAASSNSHREHRNIRLEGGLLEFIPDSSKFRRLKTGTVPFHWFITSNTPIDDQRAIMSTVKGFQQYDQGEIKHEYFYIPEAERNPSYVELYKENPALYTATQGISLGDLWIFGTPSGLVGFKDEQWFMLDKLNRLLPKDAEYKNYGGRHIYALSIDKEQNLFISTPLGLMIYRYGEAGPENLLVEPGDWDKMIAYKQARLLRGQQAVIEALPPESNAGKIIKEIKDTEKEMMALRHMKGLDQQRTMNEQSSIINPDSLRLVYESLDQKVAALFLTLEQQEKGIFQAMNVKPLEMMNSGRQLAANECIVQFVPMPDELLIHVVNQQSSEVIDLPIPRDTLLSLAQNIHRLIKNETGISRGVVAEDMEMDEAFLRDQEILKAGLRQLYQWMIRPVEQQIKGYENLILVPTEKLFYVPFASLLRTDAEGKDRYLVEDYNVGVLSTLYLFDLVWKMEDHEGGEVDLFGDPDGSLPGAKDEVAAIGSMMSSSQVYTGTEASSQAFKACTEHAGILHLATHGKLNPNDINQSSLLFSDGEFRLPQLYSLDMPKANLVVLSACESGLGNDGVEYASLARAFTHAGVPRMLATLWQVNDQASKDMMIHFYTEMENSHSRLAAFSEAQRKMIQDERYRDQPYLWAGYYYMGKP